MSNVARFKGRKLDFIHPQSIDFGTRFREEYGDLTEIVADMKERGVITPIAVISKAHLKPDELIELGESDDRQPYLLMAGGRRTKAALEAELELIPAQIYDHALDELELRIIEHHENLHRKQLSFQEDVAIKARIYDLMVEKHGKKDSTAPDAPGVSQADVASYIGVSPAQMSQDYRLAKAIEKNPEVFAGAQNKTEALKAYDALVKKEAASILAARTKGRESKNDEQSLRRSLTKAYTLGNFFDGVAKVRDGMVDLVEIDPPYSIDLKKVKREGDTDEYNEIDPGFYEEFMRETFKQSYRVMKSHGWMICWFGPDPWFEKMLTWIRDAGFTVKAIPAIWTKRSGQTMQPEHNLASAYEMFFYARKGDPGINKQGHINVFEYAPVPSKKKRHPTERPIEMMEDILQTFGRPGSIVMSPFLGSGNTILAAQNIGFPAFGWDLAKAYKDAFDVEVMTGPFKKWKSYT